MTDKSPLTVASEYLESNAGKLVDEWIEWVRSRVDTDTVNALPERALRNHIPPVLKSVARYLANPIELARSELLGNLRLHGQIRRDQGYSLEEVLAEFDGLANVVTDGVMEALAGSEHLGSQEEVLETAKRLSTGLRSVSYIAMGTYSQSAKERSQQIAENLESLSRAITHELRNPLNTMSLGLQIIREETQSEDLAPHLEAMEVATARCQYLLDTMRILTVAENARGGDQMVSLVDAVRRIEQEFRRSAVAAGVAVRVDKDLPDLRVEAVMLYIVLANVLSNSLKYRDPDKEECFVSISASYVPEEHDSGFCEIVVKDNGIGIPDEFLPRVTQKGFRAHPDVGQGTGLGLFLVNQTVESRGGAIDIRSVEGEGTEISVRMRCLESSTSDITADQFRVEHLMGESIWNEVSSSLKDGNRHGMVYPGTKHDGKKS